MLNRMLKPAAHSINRRPHRLIANPSGLMLNPLAATIFFGLVLIIVSYSVLDQTGLMGRLGPFGPILPLLVIVWLLVGISQGVKRLKRRAARIRGPCLRAVGWCVGDECRSGRGRACALPDRGGPRSAGRDSFDERHAWASRLSRMKLPFV